MSVSHREEPRASGTSADRALTLSGALLVVGFVVNAIQRMSCIRPERRTITRRSSPSTRRVTAGWPLILQSSYSCSSPCRLLVLCHALRQETPYLALLAAGGIIATSATWTVLQAVDGVTLKQAVDAWAAASGTEEATRFADAETVRWTEWGLQSYFRVLLGVAFALLGSAAVVSRLVPSWLGVLLVVAGLLSVAIGISVGYAGLESGFQDAVGIAFQLIVVVFIVGLLVVGRRAREPGTRAARA